MLSRLETAFGIDEIIAPYNQLSKDFEVWNNERVTWDQYVTELEIREVVMNNLRECSNIHENFGPNFLINLLGNLHFDNYCWKSLKSTKNFSEHFFKYDRCMSFVFPHDTTVKCRQRRELQQYRTDLILHQNIAKKKESVFDYKRISKNLTIDGEIYKAVISDITDDSKGIIKNNPNKQVIYEIMFSIFGIEVQKNPAALIYNMMMIDLLSGK